MYPWRQNSSMIMKGERQQIMHCLYFGVIFVQSVYAVLVFTSFHNHCLEVQNDHVFARPCQLIPTQNLQYHETNQLCLVESEDCLTFDTMHLPLRFQAKQSQSSSEFELVAAIGRGTLIKTKNNHLCAAVLDLHYPVHFKTCDPFDASQIFSFRGQLKAVPVQPRRPNIARLYTT